MATVNRQKVSSIAALKALTGMVVGNVIETDSYYGDGKGGANTYKCVSLTSGGYTDNGGSTIIGTDSKVYQAINKGNAYVEQYGFVGDGTAADTAKFNQALADESFLRFLPRKTYTVDYDTVILFEDISLDGQDTRLETTLAITGQTPCAQVGSNTYIDNLTIIGDRNIPGSTRGEQSHGVTIVAGSENVNIDNLTVESFAGDGMYVASSGTTWSKSIFLDRVRFNDNGRQGISIIGGHVTIDGIEITNTTGFPPSSGIDIEPNAGFEGEIVVKINNIETSGNNGPAIIMATHVNPSAGTPIPVQPILTRSVLEINNLSSYDDASGVYISADQTNDHQININNVAVKDCDDYGLTIGRMTSGSSININNYSIDGYMVTPINAGLDEYPVKLFTQEATFDFNNPPSGGINILKNVNISNLQVANPPVGAIGNVRLFYDGTGSQLDFENCTLKGIQGFNGVKYNPNNPIGLVFDLNEFQTEFSDTFQPSSFYTSNFVNTNTVLKQMNMRALHKWRKFSVSMRDREFDSTESEGAKGSVLVYFGIDADVEVELPNGSVSDRYLVDKRSTVVFEQHTLKKWRVLDVLYQDVKTVSSVAALKALTAPPVGTVITVESYYGDDNGGGNEFRRVAWDSQVDNGGTIIVGSGYQVAYEATSQSKASAKQFGAIGDGVTDDSAALNALRDATTVVTKVIDANSSFASTFVYTDVNNDNRFVLFEQDNASLVFENGAKFICTNSLIGAIVQVLSIQSNNINIYNPTLEGTLIGDDYGIQNGVSVFPQYSNITFYGGDISGFNTAGIHLSGSNSAPSAQSNNVRLLAVNCHDNGANNIAVISTKNSAIIDCIAKDSNANSNPNAGIDIEPNADQSVDGLLIKNLTASGNQSARDIYMNQGAGATIRNITIEGGDCASGISSSMGENLTVAGVRTEHMTMQNSHNLVIKDSVTYGGNYGIYLINCTFNLQRNVSLGSENNGIKISNSSLYEKKTRGYLNGNVTMWNGHVTEETGAFDGVGLSVNSSGDIQIENHISAFNGRHGVYLGLTKRVYIRNSQLYRNGQKFGSSYDLYIAGSDTCGYDNITFEEPPRLFAGELIGSGVDWEMNGLKVFDNDITFHVGSAMYFECFAGSNVGNTSSVVLNVANGIWEQTSAWGTAPVAGDSYSINATKKTSRYIRQNSSCLNIGQGETDIDQTSSNTTFSRTTDWVSKSPLTIEKTDINTPSRGDLLEPNAIFMQKDGRFKMSRHYYTQTYSALPFVTGNNGVTGSRPSANIYIGFEYFDTTLGYPIWWNGTNWVNHAGTTV